jgi:hypothetical protein
MIYSANYYPLANAWLSKIVDQCLLTSKTSEALLQSVEQLISDLDR